MANIRALGAVAETSKDVGTAVSARLQEKDEYLALHKAGEKQILAALRTGVDRAFDAVANGTKSPEEARAIVQRFIDTLEDHQT